MVKGQSDTDMDIIENKALLYLTGMMKVFFNTLKAKQEAIISPSESTFLFYATSMETLIDIISAKDVKKEDLAELEGFQETLIKIEEEYTPTNMKELRTILESLKKIIRQNRWFDMHKQSEKGFNLIGEFYGDADGDTQ